MGKQNSLDHIYSPLRYPGGKACIFPFVAELFYENRIVGINYAEPYAGGCGLALRLLFEGYSDKIYINDIDNSIYSFWKTVLNDSEKLCRWISRVSVDVKTWREFKEMQQNSKYLDDFELAKSTFYLNRTNVSGVISGGPIGGLEQTGNFKIDARFNKENLIDRITRIATLRDRIILSRLDGIDFLKKNDKSAESIFTYLDPPYYHKGADLYLNFYKKKDHENLSRHVAGLSNRWMVSYDDQDFILNLYSHEKKIRYKLSQNTSNRIGNEILVFSDKLSFRKAIQKLSSPERLRTKRKAA